MVNENTFQLSCKCCGSMGNGIDINLINILNEAGILEDELNCVYRCPKHNAEVGGESNSQHLYGTAADVDASRFGVDELAELFIELQADGIGRYYEEEGNFVHVDVRSGRIGDDYRW